MELSLLDPSAMAAPMDRSWDAATDHAPAAGLFQKLLAARKSGDPVDALVAGAWLPQQVPPVPEPEPASLLAALPAMAEAAAQALPEASVAQRWTLVPAGAAATGHGGAGGPESLPASAFMPATFLSADIATAATLPSAVPVTVPGEVGTSAWGEALGDRLAVLAAEGTQRATLRLSPEELGPVEVALTLGEDRVGVQFAAQHPETRQALQDSLPRLRELFAQAGLPQLDAGVSQHSPRRERAAETVARAVRAGAGLGEGPAAGATHVRALRLERGLLDAWA
ncbi:MAG: hypothetical protein RL026_756 [Pseudomonadota bacterium]